MLPPHIRPTLPTQNALPALSFPDGKKARPSSHLPSISGRSPHTASTSAETQAQPSHSSEQAPRLRVIDCISACVEADAAVERFETVAGRSAMVAFSVALVCESLVARPGQQGLFGLDSPNTLWTLAGCGLGAICTAVALAAVSKASKRKAGEPLAEAVLASLTSLSARGLSSGQQRINAAIDRVFEEVLSQPFVRHNLLDVDEFI